METSFSQTPKVIVDSPVWVVSEKDLKLERKKELQDRALNKFQSLGLIQRVKKDGEEVLVINDPNFFLNGKGKVTIDGQEIEKTLDQVVESSASSILAEEGKNNAKALFYIFENKKGVIAGQEEQEPRDIIYIPQNAKFAFDLETIIENKDKFIFLYSSLSKSWLSDHPTKDNEFNDHLTVFEVDMAMMIYGQGDGSRDKFNNLTVLNSNGERQPISGKWFKDNFGFHNIGDRNWGNPTALMEKFGGKLSESGLLTAKDFERPQRELKVLKNGHFMWNGDNYFLGNGYAGMDIKDLGDHKFAIINKGGIKVAFFEEGVKKGAEGLVKTIKLDKQGRSRRFITQSAINFLDEWGARDQITIVEYGEKGRKILSFDKEVITKEVEKTKLTCESRGIQNVVFDSLSFNDQILVSEAFKNVSENDRQTLWQFVEKYQEFGLEFISESQIQNNLKLKFVEFAIKNYDSLWSSFEKYSELLDGIRNLEKNILDSLPSNLPSRESETFKIFEGRLVESLKIRSMDLLKSTMDVTAPESLGQLNLLDETINAINNSIKVDGNMYSESDRPAVFEKSRATRIFVGDGKKLAVTIRPFEAADTGAKGTGQQRIQFRYTNTNGKELNLRVDSDQFGTSLDVGASGQPIVEILNRQVGSHHAHFAFEPQFSDQKTFAKMAKIFAEIFDMNIWN